LIDATLGCSVMNSKEDHFDAFHTPSPMLLQDVFPDRASSLLSSARERLWIPILGNTPVFFFPKGGPLGTLFFPPFPNFFCHRGAVFQLSSFSNQGSFRFGPFLLPLPELASSRKSRRLIKYTEHSLFKQGFLERFHSLSFRRFFLEEEILRAPHGLRNWKERAPRSTPPWRIQNTSPSGLESFWRVANFSSFFC